MDKKLQVFISSPYTDLKQERQAAVEAILSARHIPAGMELFTACDQSQFDVIKRWIDESDIFLLILGGRYGTIEPKSNKSYIQLEYEYAIETKKPFFAIVLSDSAIESKIKRDSDAREYKNYKKYCEFKESVLSKMSYFVNDIKDIKLEIIRTLTDYQKNYTLTGWVITRKRTR